MAGHSHWKGIKHHKAAQDAKRSKYFSKYSKQIMIAAREGGGDPAKNLALSYAVDRARAGNMPGDSIERAIKKATGELGDRQYEEVLYEGYGPGGVAIMCEAVTDNRSRTAPEMRKVFASNGGNLAGPGAVSFLFDRKGLMTLAADAASEDQVMEVAIEAGAEDVTSGEEGHRVVTAPQDFDVVKRALVARGWTLTTAELVWLPKTTITPAGDDVARVEALLAELEDHDDIQNLHSNYAPPAAS